MNNVRTQYRDAYAPRALSKAILKAFVEALVDFKPGLPTTSRKIRAKAIGSGKITELEGPESWKVTDPHSLAELEQVRVELLLASTEQRKCELHVEFRSGQILLSVSDFETGWGKGVFEDARILLSDLGISSDGFNERLRKAYGLLDIFQNVLLALSVAVFAVWLMGRGATYLYASLALFVAGVMPALIRSYYFFSPPRKTPIFQETVAKSRNFPWAEATAVLAFFTGVLQLAKALVSIVW
jgi:hypothetical protein